MMEYSLMLQFCCSVCSVSLSSYCLLTELTQNVLLFRLPVWDSGKNEFWFLLTRGDPITQLAGKELNFCGKITPPAINRLDVVHWSLCRARHTLRGNRVSHSSRAQNTTQTKGRLMARIITTQRFVPICVCIFWLNNFYTVLNFSQSLTQLGFSSLSLYDAAAAIHCH